jgi:hypothetical protein
VAIFVAFAWVIEAADYLGLIEIEAQDPGSRAYRLAHQGMALLKSELIGTPVEVMGEHSVGKRGTDGTTVVIESLDGVLSRHQRGQTESILDLGPGGGVSFERCGNGLEVKIHARTEDGGVYDVSLTLPQERSPKRLLTDGAPPEGTATV